MLQHVAVVNKRSITLLKKTGLLALICILINDSSAAYFNVSIFSQVAISLFVFLSNKSRVSGSANPHQCFQSVCVIKTSAQVEVWLGYAGNYLRSLNLFYQ